MLQFHGSGYHFGALRFRVMKISEVRIPGDKGFQIQCSQLRG